MMRCRDAAGGELVAAHASTKKDGLNCLLIRFGRGGRLISILSAKFRLACAAEGVNEVWSAVLLATLRVGGLTCIRP